MPYLFSTPDTTGHGSLAAAVGAVLAELKPGTHYLYDGRDLTTEALGGELLMLVAQHEDSGEPCPPITFSRSTGRTSKKDEFTIMKRDDAQFYVVTEDSVSESGNPDLLDTETGRPFDTSDVERPRDLVIV